MATASQGKSRPRRASFTSAEEEEEGGKGKVDVMSAEAAQIMKGRMGLERGHAGKKVEKRDNPTSKDEAIETLRAMAAKPFSKSASVAEPSSKTASKTASVTEPTSVAKASTTEPAPETVSPVVPFFSHTGQPSKYFSDPETLALQEMLPGETTAEYIERMADLKEDAFGGGGRRKKSKKSKRRKSKRRKSKRRKSKKRKTLRRKRVKYGGMQAREKEEADLQKAIAESTQRAKEKEEEKEKEEADLQKAIAESGKGEGEAKEKERAKKKAIAESDRLAREKEGAKEKAGAAMAANRLSSTSPHYDEKAAVAAAIAESGASPVSGGMQMEPEPQSPESEWKEVQTDDGRRRWVTDTGLMADRHPPPPPGVGAEATNLPPGWEGRQEQSGLQRYYYVNKDTGASQWHSPIPDHPEWLASQNAPAVAATRREFQAGALIS